MKFAQINKRYVAQGILMAAAVVFSGCSDTSATRDSASEIQVKGQINTGASSKAQSKMAGNLAAAEAGNYTLSCITLTSPAQAYSAAIGVNGAFAIKLPANTSVGCFIVDNASQSPVASLYVEAAQSVMGSSLSSSMNLSKDADLGSVELDLDKHEVRVPQARISDSQNKDDSKLFALEDMHGKTYILKCVSTGNAVIDAACKQKIENNNETSTVYFRVLQAMQDSKTINGLGVWNSSQAFQDCGSIDLSADDVQGALQNDGITFPFADKINLGGNFTADSVLCPLRDPHKSSNSWMNIEKYNAIGGVEQSADGYTLHVENDQSYENCNVHHKTIVHFSGKTANKLNGQLYNSEVRTATSPGGCGDSPDSDDHFIIELTQQ
ncbi:MAG: hypothetical protein ACXWQQ_14520 [Pseudobdellovibrio sp.]